MKDLSKTQILNIFAFIISCILLVVAAYLQLSKGLMPCPLCSVQRFLIFILAIIFFAGIFHKMRRQSYHGAFIIFFSLLGMIASGRQIYLHWLPRTQQPACIPKLSYLLQKFSWIDSFKILFRNSAGCGEVKWTFLNLSIPEWSLMFFILFLVLGVMELQSKRG